MTFQIQTAAVNAVIPGREIISNNGDYTSARIDSKIDRQFYIGVGDRVIVNVDGRKVRGEIVDRWAVRENDGGGVVIVIDRCTMPASAVLAGAAA